MKGKRAKKKALRAWREVYFNHETPPEWCSCGHDGMAALWHRHGCGVWDAAWKAREMIERAQ